MSPPPDNPADAIRISLHSAEFGALARVPSVFAASLRRTLPAHIPLYICSLAIFATSLLALWFCGLPMPLGSGTFFLTVVAEFLLLWVMALLAVDVFRLWRSGAPSNLVMLLAQRLSVRLSKGDRPGNSIHALIALTPIVIAFTVVKENIAAIRPFSWDTTFAQWDLALGFGHMPWEILQPVFDYPAVTVALNLVYHLWFLLMFGILVWQGFAMRATTLRMQYLLAFSFIWFFGGSVLAIAFSSAGPCFYGDLFPGTSPFAAQAAYLNRIGPEWIWSLAVQRDLWTSYVTGSGTVKGISAMPSMHLAIATLNALLCWRVDRRLGFAIWIFVGLIFLGSILLLWHYAVDGIAGIAIAVICWSAAGRLARSWHAYAQRRFAP